jgi:predicted site-specific integrase-resolvase
MEMISVAACAEKWGVAERTVRNYCANGRIPGAVLRGKTWWIPEDAERPERLNKRDDLPRTLLDRLRHAGGDSEQQRQRHRTVSVRALLLSFYRQKLARESISGLLFADSGV